MVLQRCYTCFCVQASSCVHACHAADNNFIHEITLVIAKPIGNLTRTDTTVTSIRARDLTGGTPPSGSAV